MNGRDDHGDHGAVAAVAAAVEAAARRLAAHPADLVRRTPLVRAPAEWAGERVFLKLESEQHTRSFKMRGVANKLLVDAEQRAFAAVGRARCAASATKYSTASTGNHGLALLRACALLHGLRGRVSVPRNASPAKLASMQRSLASGCIPGEVGAAAPPGGNVELVTMDTDDCAVAEARARERDAADGYVFVSPYNDAEVIAGQGTVALEALEQLRASLNRDDLGIELDVYVTVGGGGLMSGVACYLKRMGAPLRRCRVIGCQPAASACMYRSVAAGRIVADDDDAQPTLSDGSAGGVEAGAMTFDLCRRLVDEWVTVSETEIGDAMRAAWRDVTTAASARAYATAAADAAPLMVEGAAGVAIAACMKHRRLQRQRHASSSSATAVALVVVCGGNVDPEAYRRIVEQQ